MPSYFIDHLLEISQIGVKTGDLDLDLQGQIGLETKQFCVIPCEYNNF